MTATPDPTDLSVLKELVPLNSLSDDRLRELAALVAVGRVRAGETLFKEGDSDRETLYLVRGELELRHGDGTRESVWQGMPAAQHPLADRQPRPCAAVAVTDVEVVRVDNDTLDYMVAWDQLASLHDDEPPPEQPGEGERLSMRRVMNGLALRDIPTANAEALKEKLEEMPVRAGEVVVSQGEEGDYYYIIDDGQALVTRQVRLAELSAGAAFGEEALLSKGQRNATVTMLTDGRVLRLSKQDFDRLLGEPMLHWVTGEEARGLVNHGARWLDVRHPREFKHIHMPEAINVPLDELRQRMDELDPGTRYVCYCQTGQRSSAAAFVLKQHGFNVSVLKDGLRALPLFTA